MRDVKLRCGLQAGQQGHHMKKELRTTAGRGRLYDSIVDPVGDTLASKSTASLLHMSGFT
jgi:hypothetical protein